MLEISLKDSGGSARGFGSCSEIYDIRGRFWLISNYVCYFSFVVAEGLGKQPPILRRSSPSSKSSIRGNVIFYPLENGNHKIPLSPRVVGENSS